MRFTLQLRKQFKNAAALAATLLIISGSVFAQIPEHANPAAFRDDRILVKPSFGALDEFHASFQTRVLRQFEEIGGLQIVELPPGMPVEVAVRLFQLSGLVDYAEPDYLIYPAQTVTPNDPYFTNGSLWNLQNTGQNGGVAGADIRAPGGWYRNHSAPNVIVAVLDSGIRRTHEDLAANMWVNTGEIAGNGIDDDGNGYIDDVHGWNVINSTGNPDDDRGHGTAVAGIIRGRGQQREGHRGGHLANANHGGEDSKLSQ